MLTYETKFQLPDQATAIAVNKAGTILYAGGDTNEVSQGLLGSYPINPTNGMLSTPTSTQPVNPVDGIVVSPDGTEVAVASPGSDTVALYSTGTDGEALSLTAQDTNVSCPTDVSFGTSSSIFYSSACYQGGLTEFSTASGLTQTAYLPNSTTNGQTIAIGPDGVVYATTGSGVQPYTAPGFTPLGSPAPFPPTLGSGWGQTITTMNVSTDGSQLFVAAFGSTQAADYAIGTGDVLSYLSEEPIGSGLPSIASFTTSCPGVGSVCVDAQNFSITVNPGTLTISTPYTSQNPFVLPALILSSDGTYLSTSATFPSTSLPEDQQIVVTSTLAEDPGWTMSVSASELTAGSGGSIPASGLGLTNGSLLDSGPGSGTFPGSVTFTNIPALNPSPQDAPGTGPGLSTTPQTWASTPAGDGTAVMNGTLTLYAATSTRPGTYTGTLTFGVT